MADRPLKLAEAAERIGVSARSVRRLLDQGHLARAPLAGLAACRVDPASVERYLGRARGHSPRRAELAEAWKAAREAERAARRKGTGRPSTSGTKKAAATA